MLSIRFSRTGKKNRAHFRIVAQEKTMSPKGGSLEILGSYDPRAKKFVLKEDRIKYWLGKGAQASDSVYNLLVSSKVIEGKKRSVKITAKKEKGKKEEENKEDKKEKSKEVKPKEKKEEAKEEVKKEEKGDEGDKENKGE